MFSGRPIQAVCGFIQTFVVIDRDMVYCCGSGRGTGIDTRKCIVSLRLLDLPHTVKSRVDPAFGVSFENVLAFAMGTHSRLGGLSIIMQLVGLPEMIHAIITMTKIRIFTGCIFKNTGLERYMGNSCV